MTWDKHGLPGFLVNRTKDHFRTYQVNVTKPRATKFLDTIELLSTKCTMPKTSSNDHINAAFEEMAEALTNPKLREGFLNEKKENEIINELVEMFDKQERENTKKSHNSITHARARVNQNQNKLKIQLVPARRTSIVTAI